MLKKMKKKYRTPKPRIRYTLGTEVCASKLLRAWYLDSWRSECQQRYGGFEDSIETELVYADDLTYLFVQLADVVVGPVLV